MCVCVRMCMCLSTPVGMPVTARACGGAAHTHDALARAAAQETCRAAGVGTVCVNMEALNDPGVAQFAKDEAVLSANGFCELPIEDVARIAAAIDAEDQGIPAEQEAIEAIQAQCTEG